MPVIIFFFFHRCKMLKNSSAWVYNLRIMFPFSMEKVQSKEILILRLEVSMKIFRYILIFDDLSFSFVR